MHGNVTQASRMVRCTSCTRVFRVSPDLLGTTHPAEDLLAEVVLHIRVNNDTRWWQAITRSTAKGEDRPAEVLGTPPTVVQKC
jgi:hypothetical protein